MNALVLPRSVLAKLAARAATPEERLASLFRIEDPAPHASAIAHRLALWARHAARGDADRLRESLAWRGLALEAVAPALGAATLPEAAPLPNWVTRLASLLASALSSTGQPTPDQLARFLDPVAPCPFEAILGPFVAAASLDLPADTRALLGTEALRDLERGLLLRLTRLCHPVLESRFSLFARGKADRPSTTILAAQFTAAMLTGPLPPFLEDRPVLARLLVLACQNWTEAAEELATRLATDRPALVARLLGGVDPGPLTGIAVGDADLHDGHREVLILSFADEARLIYKPRPLGLDAALAGLLDWLRVRGLDAAIRVPAVVTRPGYGWAAFVEHRPVEDAEALAHHYRRAGAWVALAQALGATDLHYGNLIADGKAPVPIDLETMLSAQPRPDSGFAAGCGPGAETHRHYRSVVASMLLTWWHPAPGPFPSLTVAVDVSGLWGGSVEGQPPTPNRPTAQPQDTLLPQILPALLEGFAETYRLLLRHQTALLDPAGPLAAFAGQPVRVVQRDTATYMRLLGLSVQDEALADGADRAIVLERLHHAVAAGATPRALLPMIDAERRALEGFDVPRFSLSADSVDLFDRAGLVAADVMEKSPLDEVRGRLRDLSEADLVVQRDLLEQAVIARLAPIPVATPRTAASPASAAPADFLAAAGRIGAMLHAVAHPGADGLPAWSALLMCGLHRFTPGLVGTGLAEGRLGIALFFGALERLEGTAAGPGRELLRSLLARQLEQPIEGGLLHGHAAPEEVGQLLLAAALVEGLWPGETLATALLRYSAAALPVLARRPSGSPGITALSVGLRAVGSAFPGVLPWPPGLPLPPATSPKVPEPGLPPLDSLAFGAAGEAEVLLAAGHPAAAQARMAAALARAAEGPEGWRLVQGQPRAAIPGLQHGLAGIGFQLLRLAGPDHLPGLLPLRAMAGGVA